MSFEIVLESDDSLNSEKVFREIIHQSDSDQVGSSSEDDHTKENRIRSTKDQLNLLDTVMGDCSGNMESDDRWEQLVVQLNDIGPPIRTIDKWKRVQSIRKYEKKRLSKLDQPTISGQRKVNVGSDNVISGHDFWSQIIQKQDVMLEKQDVMLQKQDEIIQEIRKTNSILEIIANKFM